LISAGFRILRFTAADVNQRPDAVQAHVRAALNLAPLTPQDPNPFAGSATLDTRGRNPGAKARNP
jgi:hypothetical protein